MDADPAFQQLCDMAKMADGAKEFIHGKVLVLDDKYAVARKSAGAHADKEFDRADFEKNVAGLPFRFEFADAWEKGKDAYTVAEALRAARARNPDAVLLDIMFGGKDDRLGLDILRELTAQFPALPVVVMTSLGRDDMWPECMRLGAVDYLHKPLNARVLWQTLDRYVGAAPDLWLVGQSPEFLDAVYGAACASEGGQTDVMIMGGTGTGKEMLARYIGRHGARAGKPFVSAHIASFQKDQVQAELFGAKKAAYTGLDRDRQGYFDLADKGVIFLDEIGEINLPTQVSLLRVAETDEFAPMGEPRAKKVDVQIVSATNANLAKKVKAGEFRQDLWARLRGMAVTLPALAQRREDIPLLFRHLLRVEVLERCRKNQKASIPEIPEGLEERLVAAPWSENVRQLRNYARNVFDRAGGDAPTAQAFFAAWQMVEKDEQSFAAEDAVPEGSRVIQPANVAGLPGAEGQAIARMVPGGSAQGAPSDWIQEIETLRLTELAVLHRALMQTLDPVSGKPSRAKAAALLLRKQKCSTNEFDRWVLNIWNELSKEGKKIAAEQYPETVSSLKSS